jgi:hypothetical protein
MKIQSIAPVFSWYVCLRPQYSRFADETIQPDIFDDEEIEFYIDDRLSITESVQGKKDTKLLWWLFVRYFVGFIGW